MKVYQGCVFLDSKMFGGITEYAVVNNCLACLAMQVRIQITYLYVNV